MGLLADLVKSLARTTFLLRRRRHRKEPLYYPMPEGPQRLVTLLTTELLAMSTKSVHATGFSASFFARPC